MFNSHNLIRKLKIKPLIFVNVEMTFWKVNHSIKSTYCGYTASFLKLKINSVHLWTALIKILLPSIYFSAYLLELRNNIAQSE